MTIISFYCKCAYGWFVAETLHVLFDRLYYAMERILTWGTRMGRLLSTKPGSEVTARWWPSFSHQVSSPGLASICYNTPASKAFSHLSHFQEMLRSRNSLPVMTGDCPCQRYPPTSPRALLNTIFLCLLSGPCAEKCIILINLFRISCGNLVQHVKSHN